MGISQDMADGFGVKLDEDSKDFDSMLKWHYTVDDAKLLGRRQSYQVKRILFTLKNTPAFTSCKRFMLISLP